MSLCFFSRRPTQFALKQTSCVSQTRITKDKLLKQAQGPALRKPASCAATWRAGIKVTAPSVADTKRKRHRKQHIKFCATHRCWRVCVCICVVVQLKMTPNTWFAFWMCLDGKVRRTEIINDRTASFHGCGWSSSRAECVTVCRTVLCGVCLTQQHWAQQKTNKHFSCIVTPSESPFHYFPDSLFWTRCEGV